MLTVVQGSADGPTMISEDQWINLPVGENLVDHVNVSISDQSMLTMIYQLTPV